MPEQRAFSIVVDPSASGRRIDAFIAESIEQCSRAQAAELIRKGLIRVWDQVKKPAYRLQRGEMVQGIIPEPEAATCAPEPIPLDILYEDASLIVINKPPGLVVHPAPGHPKGTVVNAVLHRCPDLAGIGGELRPGIVHRLDKETSGLLVVAKEPKAMAEMARQFKSREIDKLYLALSYGSMKGETGDIHLPIGRHPVDRKRMTTVSPTGRQALTRWRVIRRLGGVDCLKVSLLTGRTHQIRVHLSAIGHPIVGDPVYCPAHALMGCTKTIQQVLRRAGRQMLHAHQIRFRHPRTGEPLLFEAPMPQDMQEILDALSALKGEA